MGKKCINLINWDLYKKINNYRFIDIIKETSLFKKNKKGVHNNC